jgi:exopolysaccharide production protein ExoQ
MPIMRNQIRKQGKAALVVLVAVLLNTLFGGGGIGYPLVELGVQIALAALAVAWVWTAQPRCLAQMSRSTLLAAGLVVLIPLLQLLPFPPSIWQNLPGREAELRDLALVGLEGTWRPLSLVPDMTLASLLSMGSAALVLVMTGSLARSARSLCIGAIALVALASLVVGAGQIVGGDGNIFRMYQPRIDYLVGFQNNRNSQADVLLIGMLCVAGVTRDLVLSGLLASRRRLVLSLVGVASAVLALGVVLTGSRTGMGLIVPVLLLQAVLLRPWLNLGMGLGWRNLGVLSLCGLVAGAALVYALRDNAAIGRALGRFATQGEARPEIWTDALFAIRTYLPWGAGMGTFLPIFIVHERLEIVSDMIVNRAHNDYLELLFEAGIPGIVALMAIAGMMLRGTIAGLRSPDRRVRGQVFCAVSILLVLGGHSLLDYPLRSMSLAGIAAVCAAILLNPRGVVVTKDSHDNEA